MAEYRLAVQIGVEPDDKWVAGPEEFFPLWVPQYLKAAGTDVEVESVGELRLDAEAQQQQANDAGPQQRDADWSWGPDTWGMDAAPNASGRWTLPVSGRPLVLLAVGGGNQVFHHWEGEACKDQGARCEVAEPAGHARADVIDVYAKAVFVKGHWADVTHFQPVKEGTGNPRVRRPRPPR